MSSMKMYSNIGLERSHFIQEANKDFPENPSKNSMVFIKKNFFWYGSVPEVSPSEDNPNNIDVNLDKSFMYMWIPTGNRRNFICLDFEETDLISGILNIPHPFRSREVPVIFYNQDGNAKTLEYQIHDRHNLSINFSQTPYTKGKIVIFSEPIISNSYWSDFSVQANSALKLTESIKINDTDFDGTQDIVTAKWGESRNLIVSLEKDQPTEVNGANDIILGITGILPLDKGGTGAIGLEQTLGDSSTKIISQKTITQELNKKFNKNDIVFSLGENDNKVPSQKTIKREFDSIQESITEVTNLVANLAGANATFGSQTPQEIQETLTDLNWNIQSQSTNTDIFELSQNEIQFKKAGTYNFYSSLDIRRLQASSEIKIQFCIRDVTNMQQLKTVIQRINIPAGELTQIHLNTIFEITEPITVRMTMNRGIVEHEGSVSVCSFSSFITLTQVGQPLLEIAQEPGLNTSKVMSQKAVTHLALTKIDKEQIALELGNSETKILSQKTATEKFVKYQGHADLAPIIYIQETPPQDAPEHSIWIRS